MRRTLSAVLEHGRIYVVDSESAWDRPEWIVRYWPTRFGRQDLASFSTERPDDKAEDIKVCQSGHGYDLKFPNCGFASFAQVNGTDRPLRFETVPYPCPKVKAGIETRYRDGRWQKLLKTGWKDA